MQFIDLTLATPAENLACDEALLDAAEAGQNGQVLRFWEPQQRFVVLGYANSAAREVNLPGCRNLNIPVLRRCSGGGTVVQAPGCLNYSLILSHAEAGPLSSITATNRYVMERNAATLSRLLGQTVEVRGHTDLSLGGKKFSGNAQRRKRQYLVFHGTFLFCFDLSLIEAVLPMPSQQPDYRENRSHAGFLTNLSLDPAVVKTALKAAWGARALLKDYPQARVAELVHEKYGRTEWNLKY